MATLKIKTGDTVRVILGKDRNKSGKVLAVSPKEELVIVDGLNMAKKHVRSRQGQGQRVSAPAPLRVSNVQLVCPDCKKSTRVGINRDGESRTRVCKKCNSEIK